MPSARSALLLLAAAAVLLRPTPTAAQDHRHALTGRVLAAESGAPLAAALVRIPNSRHRVLTDQNGRFRIAGLLPGTYPLRIETIARSSVDTAAVAGPDAVDLVVRLPARAIAIRGLEVEVSACNEPGFDPSGRDPQTAVLLDELRKNAERYREVQRTEAPVLVMHRERSFRRRRGRARLEAPDTVSIDTLASAYREGEVLVPRGTPLMDYAETHRMRLPGFETLAGEEFQGAHCFRYRGLDERDGRELVRIDFVPVPSIRTPDVRGSVFLDPESLVVASASYELTAIPAIMPSLRSLRAVATFDEPAPGLVLVREIRSTQVVERRTIIIVEEELRRVDFRLRGRGGR